MKEATFISVSDAIDYLESLGISRQPNTVIEWVSKNKLGHQLSGKGSSWLIDRVKFKDFVNGEKSTSRIV
jgi:hypothetical protein